MTGSSRGLRGGNWNNNAFNLSSSNRNTNDPSNENNNIGFRLASPCRLARARSGLGPVEHPPVAPPAVPRVRDYSGSPVRQGRPVHGRGLSDEA
jgi:hypothetical protein